MTKDNNGVIYILVRQDLFDRIVEAKGIQTKDSNETVCASSSMITEKNREEKLGRQGNKSCWRV